MKEYKPNHFESPVTFIEQKLFILPEHNPNTSYLFPNSGTDPADEYDQIHWNVMLCSVVVRFYSFHNLVPAALASAPASLQRCAIPILI